MIVGRSALNLGWGGDGSGWGGDGSGWGWRLIRMGWRWIGIRVEMDPDGVQDGSGWVWTMEWDGYGSGMKGRDMVYPQLVATVGALSRDYVRYDSYLMNVGGRFHGSVDRQKLRSRPLATSRGSERVRVRALITPLSVCSLFPSPPLAPTSHSCFDHAPENITNHPLYHHPDPPIVLHLCRLYRCCRSLAF